jgi:2,3-bisphosphoglycerate-independent phosphoglycerate mutase
VHGIELGTGDLAFRCNLVNIEGKILRDFSADHISLPEAKILIEGLDHIVQKKTKGSVRFYAGKGTGYRHLMIVKKAAKVLGKIECTPPHDIMGREYSRYLPPRKAGRLLNQLMDISADFFKDHPVNRRRRENQKGQASRIWPWGQGFPPKFPTFYQRFGFRGGVITAVDLLKGIAMHAGLDVIQVPGVTGYFDTNYVGKAEYAVNSLRSRDFVAIHVEATDEAGHMGDVKLKIKAIEDVDRLVLGTLRKALKEFGAYKILLLPDHYTCVETRTHARDPVPFFIYSSGEKKEGPEKFCEKSSKKSGFILNEGHRLMNFFVNGHA